MRRRIVLTNVVVSAVSVLLFAFLATWVSSVRLVHVQRHAGQADANRIASAIDARIASDKPLDPTDLVGFVRSGAVVNVSIDDGRAITLGALSPSQRVTATSDVPGAATVTVHISGDNYLTAAKRVFVIIVLPTLLFALLISALVSRRMAKTLVEPVRDLALVAARFGSGDPRPSHRRYGIAELDAVAEVLDSAATRVGEQLATERRAAADVSHQLRTPLTALSMRLEEVIATDDPEVARAEAIVALQQVERLSGVVDDLMASSRSGRGQQTDVDVDAVLVQQLEEWRGAYGAQGRALNIGGDPRLRARVTVSVFGQVVATLLENALVHGSGSTTVRTRTSGRSVVVEVSDQGPGVPADLARHIFDRDVSGASRSGLGLAVARALIEVEGGRLELIHTQPATFAVFLAAVPLVADGDGDRAASSVADPAPERAGHGNELSEALDRADHGRSDGERTTAPA